MDDQKYRMQCEKLNSANNNWTNVKDYYNVLSMDEEIYAQIQTGRFNKQNSAHMKVHSRPKRRNKLLQGCITSVYKTL